ncbi:hypothetical protein D3C85_1898570 [compost metagenome]
MALQAFVNANPGARVRRFSFKGVRPLISPEILQVGGVVSEAGVATIWAGGRDGIGQEGRVEFE